MRIADIHSRLVRVPFSIPIEWASGVRRATTRLVVRLTTQDGTIGWGEAQCLIDTTPAALAAASRLAQGRDVRDVEGFHRAVLAEGYYHHARAAVYGIAAIEMAMWDALGKFVGQPLWALWGGRWRDRVAATGYVFAADPAEARRQLRVHAETGHTSFKVKIGMGRDLDIRLADAAREEIGEADLRLDVNGAWTRGTARRQLDRLRDAAPDWIEQPLELSDLAGHAELRRAQPIPIALDESAYTLTDAATILRADAADALLIDPHQAGGLWQAIKIAGAAEAFGLPVGLHSGGELAISQAAYVHLAASIPNMTLPIDTERAWLGADISAAPPVLVDGAFETTDLPGLGVEIDEKRLEALTVAEIREAYESFVGATPSVKPSY